MEGKIDLSLEIGGQQFRAIRCDVEEGMSRTGKVTALVQTFSDVDFEPLLEEDATVVVTIDGLEVRRFTRRLGVATFVGIEDESLHYQLELYPALWFLRLAMNTRKFRDLPTETIVSTILGEGGVPHAWRTNRASNSRPYCVQYRETNLDFVQRLLEYEGFYYYFEDDGTMAIGDVSSAEPAVSGPPIFQLRESSGALSHAELGVTSLHKGSRLAPGRATVNDYNWKTPSVSLLQSSASEADADLDVYTYMIGYRDAGAGAVLAKLRLEALVCEKTFVEGTSTVPTFMPGRVFDFVHLEAVDFSGKYFLVRATHRFRSSSADDAKGSYENDFFAIPASVPWRPAVVTPVPNVQGNHTVMARGPAGEEIHTDQFGRAKVQFHWDREAKGTDEDSRWIRVLQETSSSMVLARVGWELVVSYVDGDADRPIAIARDINGKMMPTYGQPGHKNMMTIKTESYPGKNGFNELRMDDSAGTMRMDWHAQKDFLNVVENDKTERVVNNHTHLVKAGVTHVVEKNQTVEVGGNETKDVQADYQETIKKNRTESVGGSETVKVAKSSAMNVHGNDKETVGGVRQTFVGLGGFTVPSPKKIAQVVVPHTLGAAAEDISGGLLGGAVSDFLGGASAKDVAKGAAEGLAGAAADAMMSGGDIGGAMQGALGIPSGSDISAGLKSMVSPQNLLAKGKDMAMDMLFKGSITRDARQVLTRMVGGAYVAVAGGTIMNSANYLFTELVGGLKLTASAKGSIMQSASKFLIHTVGGLVLRKSKEDMSMSSKTSVVTVGGVTTMHSDEKVELRGKVIDIQGMTSVKFQSGDLTIELTPDKTIIKGDVRAKSGNKILISGSPDKLTA
jgi:type VI secretion system secreted protein VgrG